jgi:hypothetical protein
LKRLKGEIKIMRMTGIEYSELIKNLELIQQDCIKILQTGQYENAVRGINSKLYEIKQQIKNSVIINENEGA